MKIESLKDLRIKAGFSQSEMAILLDISRFALMRAERGSTLTYRALIRLAQLESCLSAMDPAIQNDLNDTKNGGYKSIPWIRLRLQKLAERIKKKRSVIGLLEMFSEKCDGEDNPTLYLQTNIMKKLDTLEKQQACMNDRFLPAGVGDIT